MKKIFRFTMKFCSLSKAIIAHLCEEVSMHMRKLIDRIKQLDYRCLSNY